MLELRKISWYRQDTQRVKNAGNEEYRTRTERQTNFQNILSTGLRGTVVTRCYEFRVKNKKSRKVAIYKILKIQILSLVPGGIGNIVA